MSFKEFSIYALVVFFSMEHNHWSNFGRGVGTLCKSSFNPLLHRLFLDHFLFLDNIEKIKKKFKLNFEYFENIKENGAFAPKEQMLHFFNIFK